MKQFFLVIAMCFGATYLSAQTDSTKSEFGLVFYNEWCNRVLAVDEDNKDLKEELDSLETGAYGFSAGFVYGRKLNSSWTIQSGLTWASRGYAIDSISDAGVFDFSSRVSMLEIPFTVIKEFGESQKARPFLQTGILAGYVLQHRNSWKQVGGTAEFESTNLEELNRIQWSALLSAGVEFSVYKNWRITLDARFRQAFQPLSNTDWKRYLNAGGIGIIIKKEF